MGNFYTNIVLRETDVDRVVSAVEGLRRRGYVVSADNASVVSFATNTRDIPPPPSSRSSV